MLLCNNICKKIDRFRVIYPLRLVVFSEVFKIKLPNCAWRLFTVLMWLRNSS